MIKKNIIITYLFLTFLGLNANTSTTEVKSSQSISTVISLLTTLCRGSKSVSHVCLVY